MKLACRTHDDLQWTIEGAPSVFEFDLGLNDPYFPLEDEMHFNALAKALTQFTQDVWPRFPNAKAILYRGSADFSRYFKWTEIQEANFVSWKENIAENSEEHLKRLFCAESFVLYFQMLAHKLPDELPISLILDTKDTGTLAEILHLLSTSRFEHFRVEAINYQSNIGICIPTDTHCTTQVLQKLDALIQKMPSFRPIYETHLTEEWEGLDEIHILPHTLTERGRRKLKGFEAAGGHIISRS
jgi:hypothetical protein